MVLNLSAHWHQPQEPLNPTRTGHCPVKLNENFWGWDLNINTILKGSSVIQICSHGWEPLTPKESSVITSANILFVFVCLSLSHPIRWEYWGQLWCPETSPVPSTALDAPSVLVRILNEWTTLFIYKWSAKRTHTKRPPHLNILHKQALTVRGCLLNNSQNHHHRVSVEQFLELESTPAISYSSRWDQASGNFCLAELWEC